MKWTVLLIVLSFGLSATAQRDLTPNSRKKAFGGAQSFKDYSLNGLQFQLGGTFLMNRLNNPSIAAEQAADGFRGNYTFDPKGRIGAFAEIGMFHFPKKFLKIKISDKKTIVLNSYYDWGLGFKYFRGAEDIHVNLIDQGGNLIGEEDYTHKFSNGNVYGRFSVHKNIYFKPKHRKEKINFFLDNALGFNVDYTILNSTDAYSLNTITNNQAYTKPLQIQMHYGLGFGFSPRRGMFIIPGVRIPILGFQTTVPAAGQSGKGDNSFGKPSMHWYSSRYWPIMFNVKFMFSFVKKSKGCKTGITNDQDKNTTH